MPVLVLLCFLVGTVAIALQWMLGPPLPRGESYVIIGPALVVVGVLAALLVAMRGASVQVSIGAMAACAPAVAIWHIARAVSQDPTAHNLWPLEIGYAFVIGLGPAVAGALLGMVILRIIESRE